MSAIESIERSIKHMEWAYVTIMVQFPANHRERPHMQSILANMRDSIVELSGYSAQTVQDRNEERANLVLYHGNSIEGAFLLIRTP